MSYDCDVCGMSLREGDHSECRKEADLDEINEKLDKVIELLEKLAITIK